MAFQTRDRDPLLDSNVAEIIHKRGRELFGLGLMALGVMAAMMVASYSPEDPSWLSSTDAPVHNWLGRPGASLAAPLFMIVGWASWAISLVPLVWGLRIALHRSEGRALGRLIYAPIWIAVLSLFAASLTPGNTWASIHSFGLGGLFGDMALGALFSILPFGSGSGALTLIIGITAFLLGYFVLGFTREEIRQLRYGVVFLIAGVYGWVMSLLGGGAAGAMQIGQSLKNQHAQMRDARRREKEARYAEEQALRSVPGRDPILERRDARHAPRVMRAAQDHEAYTYHDAQAQPPSQSQAAVRIGGHNHAHPQAQYQPQYPSAQPHSDHAEPPLAKAPLARTMAARAAEPQVTEPQAAQSLTAAPRAPEPTAKPAPKGGLLSRVPGFMQRIAADPSPMPEPELVETEPKDYPEDMPTGDRIKARIADAIKSRTRKGMVATPASLTPLTAGRHLRGPRPMVLDTTRPHFAELPPEPPLKTEAPATPYRAEPQLRAPQPHETPMIEVEPLIDTPEEYTDYSEQPEYEYEEFAAPQPDTAYHHQPEPQPRSVVQHPVRKPAAPSTRAQAEAQPALQFQEPAKPSFELPPLGLLEDPSTITRQQLSDEALEQNARMLESVLDDYGVKGDIVSVRPGPVVTMYELEPAPGLKASRVIGLADDIARSMSALSARVSTVPGRSVIGIELPNEHREMVLLRELLSTRSFGDGQQSLPMALGKDIGGDPVISNLAKMPHLLIAGTTGSGKSVAINTMILSLLYKLTPDQCRLIMIDPKMLELSVYDGIPHLLSPVVTDPKKAVVALKWVVAEMEERYRKMSKMGVRNIDGYNGRVEDALSRGELFSRTMQTGFDDATGEPVFETEEFAPEKMPYIVVIVDEMADLMMVAGKEIEACIQRLAQMARASGIHLIMATQRPSVDVITGTIKANFPTRISFQVTSKIDSRTILGEMGAEQLLGMGDMLYMAGGGKITRCHAPFVSDEEVEEVVKHLKSFGPAEYVGGVVDGPDDEKASDIDAVLGLGGNTDGEDALYDQAVAIVLQDRKCSTSYIQRKLAIGYNKAARLVEQMEDQGLVSAANHVGKREILVPEQ